MLESDGPMVSIVVPSYNQGAYVADTLNSIINQDYPRIEIIVVDGASTDNTLEILESFTPRIICVSEPDTGQANALNKGFKLASGQIIGWLNSDDIYITKTAISDVVSAFRRNKEAEILYGDFWEIDSENQILAAHKRLGFSLKRLLRVGYISQPATFFRRHIIEQLALDESLRYAMDTEFWLRCNRYGHQIEYIDKLIAAERIHNSAKCISERPQMTAEAADVRASYGAKFDKTQRFHWFIDRLILYALRIYATKVLIHYASRSADMAIPLIFQGAIVRNILPKRLINTLRA